MNATGLIMGKSVKYWICAVLGPAKTMGLAQTKKTDSVVPAKSNGLEEHAMLGIIVTLPLVRMELCVDLRLTIIIVIAPKDLLASIVEMLTYAVLIHVKTLDLARQKAPSSLARAL